MTKELKRWCFAVDNDRLVKLVLEGKKTATTSIYNGIVDEWREEHYKLFKSLDNNFNDKTKVVIELFEVTKKYW